MGGDPFYVGYLGLPRRHRVFLMVALPMAALGVVVGALGLSASQPAWGDGFWQTGEATKYEGTLTLEPYPMLHVEAAEGVESYLLVEMGKFGSAARFDAMIGMEGASVRVRGRELHRDGRRMIEIDPDDQRVGEMLGPSVGVSDFDAPVVRGLVGVVGEEGDFVGEIVDSKCYLGAMKPGSGRGHKSCATLCISGGIPPVLVMRGDGGGLEYRLLTDLAGRGLDGLSLERLRPMIGETVSLRGRPGMVGSWRVLRVDPAQL